MPQSMGRFGAIDRGILSSSIIVKKKGWKEINNKYESIEIKICKGYAMPEDALDGPEYAGGVRCFGHGREYSYCRK